MATKEELDKKKFEEFIALEKKCWEYLEDFGWGRMAISDALIRLEITHGKTAPEAMARYIAWATENNERPGAIAVTLGHDLNAAADETQLPRTASY